MKSVFSLPASTTNKKFVALVIDLQYDPKVDSNHKPFNPLGFSKAFDQVLNQIQLFKELGIPFGIVGYGNSPFTKGLIESSNGAPVFIKAQNSALSLSSVGDFIANADTLILSGYSCGVCVRATASDALKLSKNVWYSADTVFGERVPNELMSISLFVSDLSRLKSLGNCVLEFANLDQLKAELEKAR